MLGSAASGYSYPGIRIGNAWLAKTERSEKLGTNPGSLRSLLELSVLQPLYYDHHGNQQPSQSSMYCCTGGTECNTWQLGSVSQLYTSSILPHTIGAYKTYFWLKAGARAKCLCASASCVFRSTSTQSCKPALSSSLLPPENAGSQDINQRAS